MKPDTPPSQAARRNPIVRLFSSVWFGITLLTLILVYSSLFSAYAPARWEVEMTDMQTFAHPFFVVLCALFFAAIATTTLVRSRWTWVNAGSVTAHLGLLILTLGATTYFSSKIEGNVLLQSPLIAVRDTTAPQAGVLGRLPAYAGATWARLLPNQMQPVQLEVLSVEGEGLDVAQRATVRVHVAGRQPEVVTLDDNRGTWQSVGTLQLALAGSPPERTFYDDQGATLYFRHLASGQEIVRQVPKLPIYHERYLIGPEGELLDSDGNSIRRHRPRPRIRMAGWDIRTTWFERWDMPLVVESGNELPYRVEITGYVPFVTGTQRRLGTDGRQRDVPVLMPLRQRRGDSLARSSSAIRVRISSPEGVEPAWGDSQWVMFSQFPHLGAQPLEITLPGTQDRWQLIYSRKRHSLGATVTATKLTVDHFPGMRSVKSWHSDIAVQSPAGHVDYATVQTNETQNIAGWTLYQSGFAEDGWSWTILGVGNRKGMLLMNIGWIIVTLGCLYAFYVKPVLLRRRRQRVAVIENAAPSLRAPEAA